MKCCARSHDETRPAYTVASSDSWHLISVETMFHTKSLVLSLMRSGATFLGSSQMTGFSSQYMCWKVESMFRARKAGLEL